jgi:hypothetical protein
MIIVNKSKRQFEWAIAFWIGVGLMSIINVWKIIGNQNAVRYSWIMFGFSIAFLIVCFIMLRMRK